MTRRAFIAATLAVVLTGCGGSEEGGSPLAGDYSGGLGRLIDESYSLAIAKDGSYDIYVLKLSRYPESVPMPVQFGRGRLTATSNGYVLNGTHYGLSISSPIKVTATEIEFPATMVLDPVNVKKVEKAKNIHITFMRNLGR